MKNNLLISLVIGITVAVAIIGTNRLPAGDPPTAREEVRLQVDNVPLTPEQEVVALTLYLEARGEGANGMYAVACVIKQRSVERGLSYDQVCLEPKQFTVWNGKTPADFNDGLDQDTEVVKAAKFLASTMDVVNPEIIGNANGFFSGDRPGWIEREWVVGTYGNHTFWKEPR